MISSRIETKLAELQGLNRYRSLKFPEGIGFVDNDYLGLAGHPRLIEAGEWALRISGSGSRGSRLLGGQGRAVAQAEERLAAFFGSPAALFFSSGYLANLGLLTALGEVADQFFSDELNHASLIDGMRLTKAPRAVVAHNQWQTVEPTENAVLVAESLYSMDGDFVAEAALRETWRRSGAFLVLDEAHAAGVFREDGRGFGAPWRDWDRQAVVVTFGKAFGVGGAAVLCSAQVREWLINRARSFIYTTAAPPVVPAMVEAALDVLEAEGASRREELWERAVMVREILAEAQPELNRGDLWQRRSPIIPWRVPGDDRALKFCEIMRESGVEFRAIRYPTVAPLAERIRISLSLAVSRENTQSMAKEVVRRWTEFSS